MSQYGVWHNNARATVKPFFVLKITHHMNRFSYQEQHGTIPLDEVKTPKAFGTSPQSHRQSSAAQLFRKPWSAAALRRFCYFHHNRAFSSLRS